MQISWRFACFVNPNSRINLNKSPKQDTENWLMILTFSTETCVQDKVEKKLQEQLRNLWLVWVYATIIAS